MLPWLKNKQIRSPGVSSVIRNPEGGTTEGSPAESESYGLEDCARKVLAAIDAKDARQLAGALKEAFETMEKQPHEEAEHPES